MKPFNQMTKAEQIAYRIEQNKKIENLVPAKKAKTSKKVASGPGTRQEVTASNSSFLIQTVRGIL